MSEYDEIHDALVRTARDLLLPGIPSIKQGRTQNRVSGTIEVKGGNLVLVLDVRERHAETLLASIDQIISGEYKKLFVPIACAAFEVFDQATRIDVAAAA